MDMRRLTNKCLVTAVVACLLIGMLPNLARSDAEHNLKASAEQAIQQAEILIEQYALQLTSDQVDEDARDRQRIAETEIKRALNRFDSENYEGALKHAEEAKKILK